METISLFIKRQYSFNFYIAPMSSANLIYSYSAVLNCFIRIFILNLL